MTQYEEKWTNERGYSVPPPAEERDIVNQPMKFGPVQIGQNTFPGSSNPGGELVKEKDTASQDSSDTPIDFPQEEVSKLSPASVVHQQSELLAESLESPPSPPKFTDTVKIKVEWQGCVFNVTFDAVWLQAESPESNRTRWLTLVHDNHKHSGGPVWTPPSTTVAGEPATLKITHDEIEYQCSYFGLELFVPVCDISLTTFLVVAY